MTEVSVIQQEIITRLFLEGHGRDFVCERGVVGAVQWTRPVVLEVVRRHGWALDGSGRVPHSQRPAPPRPPARPRRPAPRALDAIAEWADGPPPKVTVPVASRPAVRPPTSSPAAAPPPLPGPSASAAAGGPCAEPAPAKSTQRGQTVPTAEAETVERFLAARTTAAPDDQFLTSPQLREAYEAWCAAEQVAAVAPPRSFGVVLTGRYRKKQANTLINGTKPICYYGLAWSSEVVVPDGPGLDDVRAAADGHADTRAAQEPDGAVADGGDLQVAELAGEGGRPSEVDHLVGVGGVQATGELEGDAGVVQLRHENTSSHIEDPVWDPVTKSYSPRAGGAPAEPPELPAARPEDWVWNPVKLCYEHRDDQVPSDHSQANADVPAEGPGSDVVDAPDEISSEDVDPAPAAEVRSSQVDVLALGLAHSDPKVRAKADRVFAAVDALWRALSPQT